MRKNRTLQVRIPAGVDDGARIRLSGEGDAGKGGGPKGDLYIFISLKPHELFERNGLDLHATAPIPMWMASLGGEIEAPCLAASPECENDCKVKVKVPEGAQTGKTVRLRGKGMPSLRNNRERGDLIVIAHVADECAPTDFRRNRLQPLAPASSDDHSSPLCREAPRHLGTDSDRRRCAEHDRHLALESRHDTRPANLWSGDFTVPERAPAASSGPNLGHHPDWAGRSTVRVG